MSGNSDGRAPSETAALHTEVEGYLLARTQHADARREAADLCAHLPWLTTAQAEDVTRHYVRQRLAASRRMLLHTSRRATELRLEYQHRYETLRRTLLRRHAACACALLVCLVGASTLVCLRGR